MSRTSSPRFGRRTGGGAPRHRNLGFGDRARRREDGSRIKVAVLWLGRVSQDTGGRTYLGEILGPLGDQPGLDVDVHLGDPDFEVPASCTPVRHHVPYRVGPAARVLAEPLVAGALNFGDYDVLLAPLNFLPPTWRGPSVVVLHNVLAFGDSLRDEVSRLRAWYRPLATRAGLRRATEILTVSEHLRELVLAHFPDADPNRVHVAPLGTPTQLVMRARDRRGAAEGTNVLVVSTLRPYKRVDQAVEAFAEATRGLGDSVLRIAGPARPAEREPLEQLADQLGVGGRVLFLGNLSHAALADLYAGADALLFLSEIESFGLPILEAMAIGVPVIAKPIGALKEVGGNAPIWVPRDADAAAIGATLRRVLASEDLRDRHARAGRAQAARFDWQGAARLTADAVRRAAVSAQPRPTSRSAARGARAPSR
ncbi:MAG: glycosyltransferase family 4 protein [Actinomycetota bacterium]|nr:glycosyltransferase family 4 protein [Actinomycetota bacterium]